jgi:hypothetical protein
MLLETGNLSSLKSHHHFFYSAIDMDIHALLIKLSVVSIYEISCDYLMLLRV